jgi:hypothetical protein
MMALIPSDADQREAINPNDILRGPLERMISLIVVPIS